MEIIEKETIKEVPAGYYYDKYDCYHNGCNKNWGTVSSPFASKGVAGTGLGLGIAGTALGLLALGRNGGLNLFGNGYSGPQNVNINTDSAVSGATYGGGICQPTAFMAWEKGCEDTLALQKGLYDWALTQQAQRFADRSTLNGELFGIYKSQVDADFGLYKSTRDSFDLVNAKANENAFNLYKSQRDADDAIRQELSDLKAQVAINAAVRPYQDKLIQCEIDKAFTAGVNYTDKKTCRAIYGEVTLPNTPTVTGFVGANACGCPRVVTTAATGA